MSFSAAFSVCVLFSLLACLAALLPDPVLSQPAPYKCVLDDDCSLNGVCDSGSHQCSCDAGWTGFDCGVVDVAAAARHSGYNLTGSGTSSWGGKPVLDPMTGQWLLFAAEFTGGCGLDYWSPMSRIVRAVSETGPAGPYTFDGEVVGTFAHNPTVVWNGSNKLWLLYHIGCPVTQPAQCQYGGIQCDDANNENGESSISMWESADLKIWTPRGVVLGPNKNNTWDMDTTNPSPFPLWTPEDNTTAVLLAYRGCPYNCGPEMLNLAFAEHYLGPYHRLHSHPIFENAGEDPFVWRDKRGHFHLLMHSFEDLSSMVGRHAYARRLDGHWTFGNRTLAFNTTVQWTDGTRTEYNRRERPQLVFSDDGLMTPLYLTNGVQEVNQSSSYTVIQPLSTAAVWERQHGYRRDEPQQQKQHRHARDE